MSASANVKGTLREYFVGQQDVVLVYLFGSRAMDRAGPLSDVDVGVVLDSAASTSEFLDRRLELVRDLERLLGLEVDVVILNESTPLLAHRVISRGILVLSRDETFRVRFETKRVGEYLDTAYLRETYDRVLAKRAREGRLFG